jgi:hypothetical protein
MAEGRRFNVLRIQITRKARSFDHWAYLLVLLLDLLHVTLFTKAGNGDKPDGYVEAMAICAAKPNISIFL